MFREMRVICVYVCTYITDGSIGGIARANAIHTARQMRSSSFRRVRVKGCPNNIPFTESPPHPPPASNLVRPRALLLLPLPLPPVVDIYTRRPARPVPNVTYHWFFIPGLFNSLLRAFLYDDARPILVITSLVFSFGFPSTRRKF